MTHREDKTILDLERALKGSEVVSVSSNPDLEGLFTLHMKTKVNEKKYEVRISGSDLGFYFKKGKKS